MLLACTALQAFAQASIKLRILQKGSGDPIGRAEIKVGADKTYTDPKGEAQVTVPQGEGVVEIYKVEFETLRIDFKKLRDQKEYELYLLPALPTDNEIVVRGVRRPEASRKQVTVEEAVRVAPGGDPAQVPKLLPGVQSSPFRPEIVVRGSGPND